MSEAEMLQFLSANWPLLVLITLWALPWKGVALWQSAKRGHKWWFIVMLITNSAAIVEIFYLFFIVKIGRQKIH